MDKYKASPVITPLSSFYSQIMPSIRDYLYSVEDVAVARNLYDGNDSGLNLIKRVLYLDKFVSGYAN